MWWRRKGVPVREHQTRVHVRLVEHPGFTVRARLGLVRRPHVRTSGVRKELHRLQRSPDFIRL